MGGHYIRFNKCRGANGKCWIKAKSRSECVYDDPAPQPSAFHLPEVCRQIYSETAILAYMLNTLIINGSKYCEAWKDSLITAQKVAVRSVALAEPSWRMYVSGLRNRSLRAGFPNVRRIEMPKYVLLLFPNDTISSMEPMEAVEAMKEWDTEQSRALMEQKVKKMEGEDVEVIFYHEANEDDWEDVDPQELCERYRSILYYGRTLRYGVDFAL